MLYVYCCHSLDDGVGGGLEHFMDHMSTQPYMKRIWPLTSMVC